MLPNIKNIQILWLTVGPKTAQICLWRIMIWGQLCWKRMWFLLGRLPHRFTSNDIQECIRDGI